MAIGEANRKSSTFTINNRLPRQIVWAPCAMTRRPKIRLKQNFARIFDINARHRKFLCPKILWITLPTHGDRCRIMAFSDRVPEYIKPIKMSPRVIDRSIEILQTQIDLYNYFLYISCHFVTYGNT